MIKRLPSIILGLAFVISGVTKGVDPMGLVYKLEEYLNAFGFANLSAFSTLLSVILCGVEIALGLFLLLNRWRKAVSIGVTIFMVLFTVITYEIYTNPYLGITECGCFGDAIELSNGATFWKNIVLLLFAIINTIIAFSSNLPQKKKEVKSVVLALFVSFSLPLYSYYFLPPFDFLGYNIGDDMNVTLYDADFNDVTSKELVTGKSSYIVTARRELTAKNLKQIELLTLKAQKEHRNIVAISSNIELIDNLKGVTPYFADDLAIKSMIRIDVGVLLVNDGVIKGKWSIDTILSSFNENFQRFKLWLWIGFYSFLIVLMFRINYRDYEK